MDELNGTFDVAVIRDWRGAAYIKIGELAVKVEDNRVLDLKQLYYVLEDGETGIVTRVQKAQDSRARLNTLAPNLKAEIDADRAAAILVMEAAKP